MYAIKDRYTGEYLGKDLIRKKNVEDVSFFPNKKYLDRGVLRAITIGIITKGSIDEYEIVSLSLKEQSTVESCKQSLLMAEIQEKLVVKCRWRVISSSLMELFKKLMEKNQIEDFRYVLRSFMSTKPDSRFDNPKDVIKKLSNVGLTSANTRRVKARAFAFKSMEDVLVAKMILGDYLVDEIINFKDLLDETVAEIESS